MLRILLSHLKFPALSSIGIFVVSHLNLLIEFRSETALHRRVSSFREHVSIAYYLKQFTYTDRVIPLRVNVNAFSFVTVVHVHCFTRGEKIHERNASLIVYFQQSWYNIISLKQTHIDENFNCCRIFHLLQ